MPLKYEHSFKIQARAKHIFLLIFHVHLLGIVFCMILYTCGFVPCLIAITVTILTIISGDKFSWPNAWESTSDVSLEAPITFLAESYGSSSPFWLALECCLFVPSTPVQRQLHANTWIARKEIAVPCPFQ
jgi:hypothetical protein